MDNHPIPQDVTGFQFKLIGSMTIKQFGFIAAGVIPAVVIYYSPVFILLKFILIPIFGLTGVAMAFLPIEGRPMDVMIANFIKALVTPNQYLFHKEGRKLALVHAATRLPSKNSGHSSQTSQQLEKERLLTSYLNSSHLGKQNALDQKESLFLSTLHTQNTSGAQATQPIIASPLQQPSFPVADSSPIQQQSIQTNIQLPVHPDSQASPTTPIPHDASQSQPSPAQKIGGTLSQLMYENAKIKEGQKEPEKIALRPVSTQNAPTVPLAPPPLPREIGLPHPDAIKSQLEEVASQKAQLELELAKLKSQLEQHKNTTQPIQVDESTNKTEDFMHVRKVPQNLTQSVGIATAPDTPNLISGIVKDPRGNVLGNILVEVKDKDGNPVRAFKTNPLGQFASATKLSNGVYTIEFEDQKGEHRFDTIELTVNDSIILPLEIISHDEREDLRKALFN